MPGMLQPTRYLSHHEPNTLTVTIMSPVSKKYHTMTLPITLEEWEEWQSGRFIQIVWPHLTDAIREWLMTGITEQEWNRVFHVN
jgi:hypothetical protein